MSKYIYFVGKPHPNLHQLDVFKNSDYKFGVFLDKNIKPRNLDRFDNVIDVDFSSPATIEGSVSRHKPVVDGLLCTYENYIPARSQLAGIFEVTAQSIESAMMSTDKYLMRQAFLSANPLITPRFELISTLAEARSAAKQLTYPLIIKPTNLVKSLLVLKCDNETELISNFQYAQEKIDEIYKKYRFYNRQPQLIIEQYIEGKICSIAAFVDGKGTPHFCEGIVDLANAHDIGVDDNYLYRRLLPAEFDQELAAGLFKVAEQGIKALEMSSVPAHVELIYNDREIKLIEIGARIGGYRPRMYGQSYGIDLIDQEVRLALGKTPDLSGDFKAYSAVYELFPETEGKFAGIDALSGNMDLSYYSIKAKPGVMVGPAKNGFKAAAIVMVSDPKKAVFLKLCRQVEAMKVRIKE